MLSFRFYIRPPLQIMPLPTFTLRTRDVYKGSALLARGAVGSSEGAVSAPQMEKSATLKRKIPIDRPWTANRAPIIRADSHIKCSLDVPYLLCLPETAEKVLITSYFHRSGSSFC